MVLSLFFLFFLLLENLILPALIGPHMFSITVLFLIGLAVYSSSLKVRIVHIGILLLIAEIFTGNNIGNFLIPFGITVIIYLWLNRFFSISSGVQESNSFAGIIGGSIAIMAVFYLYSWFFILFGSSYNINSSLTEWRIFLAASIFSTLSWAVGFAILFKYVLRIK